MWVAAAVRAGVGASSSDSFELLSRTDGGEISCSAYTLSYSHAHIYIYLWKWAGLARENSSASVGQVVRQVGDQLDCD